MKYFLLIAGNSYYPQVGTDNWIGCFETFEEANSKASIIEHKRVITRGKNKGQEEITGKSYRIGESIFDWFDVVDLRKWMENNK